MRLRVLAALCVLAAFGTYHAIAATPTTGGGGGGGASVDPADSIPPASNDDLGALGASVAYAREDHKHPYQREAVVYYSAEGHAVATAMTGTLAVPTITLTEDADVRDQWAQTAGKAEWCFSGSLAVAPKVSVSFMASKTATPAALTSQLAVGTSPVVAANVIGASISHTLNGAGLQTGEFLVESNVAIDPGECVALLTSVSPNASVTIVDMAVSIFIDEGIDATATDDQGPFAIFSRIGDALRRAAAWHFPESGGLWFPLDLTTSHPIAGRSGADGPTTIVVGNPTQTSSPEVNSLFRGLQLSSMKVYSKTFADGGALELVASSSTNEQNVLRFSYASVAGQDVMRVAMDEPTWIHRLEALGYNLAPGAGIAADWSGSSGTDNFGWVYASSSPGEGGGFCVLRNDAGADPDDFAGMMADATCIAIDTSATTAEQPNGQLFIDGDRDGTRDAGEPYLGSGANTVVPLYFSAEAPVNGSWPAFDVPQVGYTATRALCLIPAGTTASVQVSIDDGSPANVFGSAYPCTTTVSYASGGTIANGAIAADSIPTLTLSNVTGNPSWILVKLIP